MLKVKFDAKVVKSDPFQAFLKYAINHPVDVILNQMYEECRRAFVELHTFAKAFETVPEFAPFVPILEDVRFDVKPDGKPDDWYFNVTGPERRDDKVVTTERVRNVLARIKRTVPADAYVDKPEYSLGRKLESLRKRLNTLEHLLAIGYYALPIYYQTHEPTPIPGVDWNKPLKGQVLEGYVWHKLINRGYLPEEVNEHKYMLRPVKRYRLMDDNTWAYVKP